MKVITFHGKEPKIVEDAHMKYLLVPEGCRIRVQDLRQLEDIPDGQFLTGDRFWEAIAKVFGIIVTDGKVFRGNNGFGQQDLVMRLAHELGFALYLREADTAHSGEDETVHTQ